MQQVETVYNFTAQKLPDLYLFIYIAINYRVF